MPPKKKPERKDSLRERGRTKKGWPCFELSYENSLRPIYEAHPNLTEVQFEVFECPLGTQPPVAHMDLFHRFTRLKKLWLHVKTHGPRFLDFKQITTHPTLTHLRITNYWSPLSSPEWIDVAKSVQVNQVLRVLMVRIRSSTIAVPFITHILQNRTIVALECGKPWHYLTDENYKEIQKNTTLQCLKFRVNQIPGLQQNSSVSVPSELTESIHSFLALQGEAANKSKMKPKTLIRRWQVIQNHLKRNQKRIFYFIFQMAKKQIPNHPLFNSLFDTFALMGRFLDIHMTHAECKSLKFT